MSNNNRRNTRVRARRTEEVETPEVVEPVKVEAPVVDTPEVSPRVEVKENTIRPAAERAQVAPEPVDPEYEMVKASLMAYVEALAPNKPSNIKTIVTYQRRLHDTLRLALNSPNRKAFALVREYFVEHSKGALSERHVYRGIKNTGMGNTMLEADAIQFSAILGLILIVTNDKHVRDGRRPIPTQNYRDCINDDALLEKLIDRLGLSVK